MSVNDPNRTSAVGLKAQSAGSNDRRDLNSFQEVLGRAQQGERRSGPGTISRRRVIKRIHRLRMFVALFLQIGRDLQACRGIEFKIA